MSNTTTPTASPTTNRRTPASSAAECNTPVQQFLNAPPKAKTLLGTQDTPNQSLNRRDLCLGTTLGLTLAILSVTAPHLAEYFLQ